MCKRDRILRQQLKELFKVYWAGKFDDGGIVLGASSFSQIQYCSALARGSRKERFPRGKIIMGDVTLPLTRNLFDAVFFLTEHHLWYVLDGEMFFDDYDRYRHAEKLLRSVFWELFPISDVYYCEYVIPIFIIATVKPILFAILAVSFSREEITLLAGTPDKYIRRVYKCRYFSYVSRKLTTEAYLYSWLVFIKNKGHFWIPYPSPPLAIANFLLNWSHCLAKPNFEQAVSSVVSNPLLHLTLLNRVSYLERVVEILSRTNSSLPRWKSLFNSFFPIIAALNIELEDYYDTVNNEQMHPLILGSSPTAEEIYNALLEISPEEAVKRVKEMIVNRR